MRNLHRLQQLKAVSKVLQQRVSSPTGQGCLLHASLEWDAILHGIICICCSDCSHTFCGQ